MGFFGELYYNEQRPQIIGQPVEDIKELHKNLDTKYWTNLDAQTAIETAVANIDVREVNRGHVDNALNEIKENFREVRKRGDIEHAQAYVRNSAKLFAENKYVKGSIKDLQQYQEYKKELDEKLSKGEITQDYYNILMYKSSKVNNKPIELGENGEILNVFNGFKAENEIEINKYVNDIISKIKPEKLVSDLRSANFHYLASEIEEGVTPERIKKAVYALYQSDPKVQKQIAIESEKYLFKKALSRSEDGNVEVDDNGNFIYPDFNIEDIKELGIEYDMGGFYTKEYVYNPDTKSYEIDKIYNDILNNALFNDDGTINQSALNDFYVNAVPGKIVSDYANYGASVGSYMKRDKKFYKDDYSIMTARLALKHYYDKQLERYKFDIENEPIIISNEGMVDVTEEISFKDFESSISKLKKQASDLQSKIDKKQEKLKTATGKDKIRLQNEIEELTYELNNVNNSLNSKRILRKSVDNIIVGNKYFIERAKRSSLKILDGLDIRKENKEKLNRLLNSDDDSSVLLGFKLIASVYKEKMQNPSVFAKSMLPNNIIASGDFAQLMVEYKDLFEDVYGSVTANDVIDVYNIYDNKGNSHPVQVAVNNFFSENAGKMMVDAKSYGYDEKIPLNTFISKMGEDGYTLKSQNYSYATGNNNLTSICNLEFERKGKTKFVQLPVYTSPQNKESIRNIYLSELAKVYWSAVEQQDFNKANKAFSDWHRINSYDNYPAFNNARMLSANRTFTDDMYIPFKATYINRLDDGTVEQVQPTFYIKRGTNTPYVITSTDNTGNEVIIARGNNIDQLAINFSSFINERIPNTTRKLKSYTTSSTTYR